MSEYQFYEFQAIDRPLSPEEREYVQSLSSRVKLTATNAQFLYNYGDFRGEPEKLLDFNDRMMELKQQYKSRSSLITRLQQVGVLS